MVGDEVRLRLDKLIRERGTDYATLSRIIGRNAAYIQQFIKRGVPRRLSEIDRRRLAAYFGVPEVELGAPLEVESRHRQEISYLPDPSFIAVPFHAVGASAGAGALPDSEVARTAVLFQPRYARQLASGALSALSAIEVAGDSMLPTLADGDQIVVDMADCERLRDGIYVIRLDDALLVKRLAINPATRRISIISDNGAYPSFPDCHPNDVTVIGRVVWVGRKLS